MSTSRLEAFSDGVIAVAITLLVLNITVPDPAHTRDLAHELGHNWPNYVAYAISFTTIGIIWINHHAMVGRLREADHTILVLNTLLLLTIALLPFATALMAQYLRASAGENLAAAVYGGALLMMSIAFSVMNRHILLNRAHLLRTPLPEAQRRQILTRGIGGLIPYVLATALAPVSPYVTVAICGAVAMYYATPVAQGAERNHA
jgi:uncharacterized membrane protein